MSERFINPIFIGHGSPMNAISENAYTRFLSSLAQSFSPTAILVVSAHWRTKGTRITGAATPEQIYDFFGFPDELYGIKYAPPESRISPQRSRAKFPASRSTRREASTTPAGPSSSTCTPRRTSRSSS